MTERIAETDQGLIRFVRTRQPEPHAFAFVVENRETGKSASITLSSDAAILLANMIEGEAYLLKAERLANDSTDSALVGLL